MRERLPQVIELGEYFSYIAVVIGGHQLGEHTARLGWLSDHYADQQRDCLVLVASAGPELLHFVLRTETRSIL